jgi:16S rRNA (adenine1518-N6/adenine1519-N6)-dimethyltransferase
MVRARRRFGQHFLSNPRILARIAEALDPGPGARVLEIGPGLGALTAVLLSRGAKVTAIEIDRDLAAALREKFPDLGLIEGDALELDWHALVDVPAEDLLVAGNIPYNITSPLIDQALRPPRPRRIVFLVQKEVADRVTARAGTSAYGALTVGVQVVARAERLFIVPAGAFHPAPRVDSAVLRLTPLEVPLVPDAGIVAFRRMVTGLFSFRRKQLARGLRELTGWPAAGVGELLDRVGVEPTARAESLSPAEFVRLFGGLVDGGWRSR